MNLCRVEMSALETSNGPRCLNGSWCDGVLPGGMRRDTYSRLICVSRYCFSLRYKVARDNPRSRAALLRFPFACRSARSSVLRSASAEIVCK